MNTRRRSNVLVYINDRVVTQLKLIVATLTKLCAVSQLITKLILLRLISINFLKETKRDEQRLV